MIIETDYLSLLRKHLGETRGDCKHQAVKQIEANTASLCYQVRETSKDGVVTLLGTIRIAVDEQLTHRADSVAADDLLRMKLERLGLSCHE